MWTRARNSVGAVLAVLAVLVAVDPAAGQEPHAGQKIATAGPVAGDDGGKEVDLHLVGGLALGVPIYNGDFADPFVLATTSGRFAYATNTTSAHVPVVRQIGNVGSAAYLGDALPSLPAWTEPGRQWAPSVWARPDGRFVLYYSTRDVGSGRQCISRGVATSPAGPFVDESSSAMICPTELGGAIDPSIVDEGGSLTMLWKSDGNCCDLPTRIYSQRLSPDGLSTAGPAVELISATEPWEGGVVEGPSMIVEGDTYFLFYSANLWDTPRYAIGIARCESAQGPCRKEPRPWMTSTTFAKGPGGQEFFEGPGGVWMVYHGWPRSVTGQRRLYLDLLAFHGDGLPTRRAARLEPSSWLGSPVSLSVLGAGVVLVVLLVARRRRSRRR